MQAIHLAWSPKFQADGVSSSGGVTRAILANSLKNGTPVVCLAWDADRSDYSPRRLESLRDIDLVPGSIYHSTTFVGALDLIRSAEDPVVLIAIPCQLSGLLQYIANHEHSLAKKIGLVVGIVCGWMYSHHAVKAFAQFIGSEQPDVTKTTYRGGDRVGKLVVRSRGKDQSFDRRKFQSQREAINYQSSFSRDMNRLRCRMCQDHLNLAADIVVGDAWLSRNSDKKSIVACRTSRGEAALSALVRANALKLEPSSLQDILESQSPNLVYGQDARRMSAFFHAAGKIAPSFGYRDADDIPEITMADACNIRLELFRRWVARRHYATYRLIYILRQRLLRLSGRLSRFIARARRK